MAGLVQSGSPGNYSVCTYPEGVPPGESSHFELRPYSSDSVFCNFFSFFYYSPFYLKDTETEQEGSKLYP